MDCRTTGTTTLSDQMTLASQVSNNGVHHDNGEDIYSQRGKRTYTVEEIQSILEISKSTAYELVKKNIFRSINVGRHIRISKKSFDTWLDNQS